MIEEEKPLSPDQYVDSKNLSARIDLHAQFTTNKQGWTNWLFEQFSLGEGTHILELGSGPGSLWRNNVKDIPANCYLVLSDASSGMISEAKQVLNDSRVTFEVFDAHTIPHLDSTFDFIIANHMLYHVADLSHTLSEITRVLKPDGKLYAATNGVLHMNELNEMIRRSIPTFEVAIQSFTLENGEGLLRDHFGDVTLNRYEDSLVVPDVSALLAYMQSMGSLLNATELQRQEIERIIEEEVHRQGAVRILKDTGLFTAEKPQKA